MKKIFYFIMVLSIFIGCSDADYEELNRDPNNPTQVSADQLFVSATKSLFDQMESTNVNINVFRLFSQYWTETTYTDEENYDLNNRRIPDNHWSEIYRDILFDIKDAKSIVEAEEGTTSPKIGQLTVLEVYAWQILVDTFGDIPFTEALQGKEIKSPVYDNDTDVYNALATMIDSAISTLNSGQGFESSDLIYGGDLSAWSKFANSLKLKLGARLSEVNPTLAGTMMSEAVSGGVFTSNNDNATLAYEGTTPNTNPIWIALVQSGRNDFVAANTLVDHMNSLDDPRRSVYFKENLGADTYVGGTYGASATFSAYTHVGEMLHDPTFRGVLMDYAEVEFSLAEAVELGIVSGSAESHYNAGVTASFNNWGVSDVATYLANPDVAYTTASGTWKEKIGMQYWLAMYNRGFEGWYVYRKFDAPTFNVAATSGLPVPKRYTYPIAEQSINEANWSAASSAIGGDEQQTSVFWDVN